MLFRSKPQTPNPDLTNLVETFKSNLLSRMGFFTIAAWLTLYVIASFTVLLVLSAPRLNLNFKYGIISGIGLLAFCIVFIRMQSRPFNRTRLFYLNSYYSKMNRQHSVILERMDYRSVYQDYSGQEVDMKEILERKRFLHVFESPKDFELMDVVVEILEKRGNPYLYVNFNNLPALEKSYSDKDEFWGLVTQSLIYNFQKIDTKPEKGIVLLFDKLTKFYGAESELEQLIKWEYFAEIIDTICKRLEYVNIVMVTEDPEVTELLEGKLFIKQVPGLTR